MRLDSTFTHRAYVKFLATHSTISFAFAFLHRWQPRIFLVPSGIKNTFSPKAFWLLSLLLYVVEIQTLTFRPVQIFLVAIFTCAAHRYLTSGSNLDVNNTSCWLHFYTICWPLLRKKHWKWVFLQGLDGNHHSSTAFKHFSRVMVENQVLFKDKTEIKHFSWEGLKFKDFSFPYEPWLILIYL